MTLSDPGAEPRHYSAAMMAIHWATAVLILSVLVLAWTWPSGPARDSSALLMLHKSVGLTILALAALRVVVRSAQTAPAELDTVSRLESAAAHVTHLLLYAILIAMPFSGYLWATARGADVSVFGLFSVPPLFAASDTLRGVARTIHSAGQYAVYIVVGLHAAAALYHLVVRRDEVMARMVPGARLTPRPPSAGAHPAAR